MIQKAFEKGGTVENMRKKIMEDGKLVVSKIDYDHLYITM